MIVCQYFEVNNCLENNAEANERKKLSSGKLKPVDGNPSASDTENEDRKAISASIRHHQRESTPRRYPLVISLVKRNSPNGTAMALSGVSREDAHPTDKTGFRRKTLFIVFQWATCVP